MSFLAVTVLGLVSIISVEAQTGAAPERTAAEEARATVLRLVMHPTGKLLRAENVYPATLPYTPSVSAIRLAERAPEVTPSNAATAYIVPASNIGSPGTVVSGNSIFAASCADQQGGLLGGLRCIAPKLSKITVPEPGGIGHFEEFSLNAVLQLQNHDPRFLVGLRDIQPTLGGTDVGVVATFPEAPLSHSRKTSWTNHLF